MSPEIERAVRTHQQWFGSYKANGEIKKVAVWLTVNSGQIEFLTPGDSYKAKRVRRNPSVVCFLGSENGPAVAGRAEIVTDPDALWRGYRAYWKSHPFAMVFLWPVIKARIKTGKQVLIRVQPEEPNPLAAVTSPATLPPPGSPRAR